MSAAPSPATAPAATTGQPELQFRSAPAVSGSDFAAIMGISLAVILVYVGVMVALKRSGVLRRWLVPASDGRMRVVASQRIGAGTLVNLLEVDGEPLLVVESARQVAVERLSGARAKAAP